MKKEEKNKVFEKWIRKQIDFYAPIIGVELHKIDIEYKETESYIAIKCTYPYLDPTIYYSQCAVDAWKKGEVAPDRILHELCHILTDPLYCKAISRHASKEEVEDERERLTDVITSILRKLI